MVHRLGDDTANLVRRFDKMRIVKMSVARRGAMPSMAEELARVRQILARHDRLAGGGMPFIPDSE